MNAEAWMALGFGALGLFGTILTTAWLMSGQLSKAITRFEVVGAMQATEITEIKNSVRRLEDVVALVAVQKDQIQSIRDSITLNTARTDETFKRIFGILDSMRKT